jgi:large subunit ribosomal protein L4
VVFGPHPRDYSKKISKKTKRVALRKALSARILAGDVIIVPDFTVASPKTKDFVKLMGSVSPEPKTLIVAKEFDVNTKLAARNVQPAQLITSADVNTEHLLLYKKIVLTNDALTQLAERINK